MDDSKKSLVFPTGYNQLRTCHEYLRSLSVSRGKNLKGILLNYELLNGFQNINLDDLRPTFLR